MRTTLLCATLVLMALPFQNAFGLVIQENYVFSGEYELIEDIDGDGIMELVRVGDYPDETLYIYDLSDNETAKYSIEGYRLVDIFDLTDDSYVNPIDLNGNGSRDLISRDTNRVIIYDFVSDESLHEFTETGATYMDVEYLEDIDGDGFIDIMMDIEYEGEDSSLTKIFGTDVATDIDLFDDDGANLPSNPALRQNYPNPFNPSTAIEFQVQRSGHVRISIYNTLGQLVNTLVDEVKRVGDYTIHWNGKDSSGKGVASGVYFYQLQVDDFVSSKKMVLVK